MILDLRGANDDEWLLVSEYVFHIWNRIAHGVLKNRVPLEVLTGITPDISHIYQYHHLGVQKNSKSSLICFIGIFSINKSQQAGSHSSAD